MHDSEHFITSYRVRLKIVDITKISEVELWGDNRWRFSITTFRVMWPNHGSVYHYTMYESEFEARAVREALHARL